MVPRPTSQPWHDSEDRMDDALARYEGATDPTTKAKELAAARIAYEALGDVLDAEAERLDVRQLRLVAS